MKLRHWLPGLAFLVLSAPAQQEEGRIYFSLSTEGPVRPGESAPVRVQAQGIKTLDFRLYKVNDPSKFFHQLADPHQFSGRMRPTPKARTPLEKFAAWKRQWRTRMRDLARTQFSGQHRQLIRAALDGQPQKDPKQQPASKAPQFAGLPILNPQQLVKQWSQPIQTPNRWEAATVPLVLNDKGVYVIEATDGSRQAYSILMVTNLALVAKGAPGRLLVRALDRTSGQPLAGTPVEVFEPGAAQYLSSGPTGADGVLEVKLADVAAEGVLVIANRGADFAAATVGAYSIGANGRGSLTGYVYTDRPIYRPGHTAHYKAILRTMNGTEYALPADASATVEIEDSDGKPLLKKKAAISKFGTLAGEVTLPADAALGYYSVNVALSGGEFPVKAYGGFQVQEYRKPDYEVKVTPEARRLVQGNSMRVTVEAKYYYGEPVAGASVTWVAHRARYWLPWYEQEEGADGEEGDMFGGEQMVEQKAKLDANGRLVILVPTSKWEFDAAFRVEARVTDSSNREISGSGAFVATRGPFYINAQTQRYVYGPGDPVKVAVETKDYDGKAVGGVAFRLEVAPWSAKKTAQAALSTQQSRTGPDGKGTVEFPAPPSGSYVIRTTAGELNDTAYLWVSGAWSGSAESEAEQIRMIPDKQSYRPGETAKVLIVAGVPQCNLWLSLEGKTLYWSRYVAVEGGTVTVDVPIESGHAPNVYLNAIFLKNNRLHQGTKLIKVPPVEKQIQVELTAARKEYKPGEPAQFALTAKDHKGQPVRAEFSLGVVDEAIYALAREQQPDILKVFYGQQWNRVSTDTSLDYYFSGEAGTHRMMLARVGRPLARAQLKPERLTEPKVRKNFPDTAHWVADLTTGADGRAETQVTFPDSLTTWRATAKGVTEDTRVGSAVERTIVRKNVMVTMATPRFFTEGDEVTVPVLVRNYTSAEQRVQVSLQAQGAQIQASVDGEVSVAAKGETRVDYRLRIPGGAQAVLTAKALTTGESDAMELTIPIEPYGLKRTMGQQTRMDGTGGRQNFSFDFPASALPGNRFVTVHLTPSAAGAVFGALEYLITYPYGCTEQTMSSFLPNVMVAQAMKELKLASQVNEKDLAKKVRAGLERLYSFQHEDGGWGWWKGDASDPFMTAYVAAGLKLASGAGYQVEEGRAKQAAKALAQMLAGPAKIAPDTRAYALYAIALQGKPEAALTEAVWAQREKMTSFGWALLGLTFQQIRDARAAEVASHLVSTARQEGEQTHWASDRDPMLDFELDNSHEATAFAVKFLAQAQPQSPLIDQAALWLVNHREQGYYWSTTKKTAFVIYGLTDVLKRSGELKPDYSVKVSVDGREVLAKSFSAEDALRPQPVKIRVPLDGRTARPVVTVARNGTGRLYVSQFWEYRASGASDGERAEPAGSSLRINRNYYRLTAQPEGGRIVYGMEPLEGAPKPGDLVAVRLSIFGGANERYLLVDDPLPAGAEVIERDELYEIRGKPAWWRSWFERREVRDSHVTYYPWAVPKEGLEYVYLLRFTNAGKFGVAPARVEPMYRPNHLSWSEPKVLEVKP